MLREHSNAPPSGSAIRFTVTVAAWVVGLFGLMRAGWVQQNLLLPFAGVQQRLASDLMGAPPNAVVVDLSCTGADAIALCLGVIFAFPASWRARLRGGILGLLLISVLNTARIGTLSFVAGNGSLMNLLHIYVWPAILIVAVAAYVFAWMNGVGALTREPERGLAGAQSGGVGRRFLLLTGLSVVAYFALAPSMFQSTLLFTVGGWAATSASAIILALGGMATVSGNTLSTSYGSFIVTQECLATPLIPVYAAGALSIPLSPIRRVVAVLVAPFLFFAIGTARLLVLALPNALVPSHLTAIHAFSQVLAALVLVVAASFWLHRQSDSDPEKDKRGVRVPLVAIGLGAVAVVGAGPAWSDLIGTLVAALQGLMQHAGHTYVDAQGAFAILPVFQLGLFVALWIVVSRWSAWRRLCTGLVVLALAQVLVSVGLGELYRHIGFDPHVSLIRAWALSFPVVLVWLLERPFEASRRVVLIGQPLPQAR